MISGTPAISQPLSTVGIASQKKTRWERIARVLLPVTLALVFFAVTFAYYPFRAKIQFDTDEGLNLMRSMLVVKGYPLYQEVSSDQPPLFTHLLGLLFRVVGFKVNAARVLILLFSTLLVWSCTQFLVLAWGKVHALLFLAIALMIPRFLELSVAVMIGLPSIAMVALSMLFVHLWHQDRKVLWLALSGFAFALSMLIKLFTGFLIPVILIGITLAGYLRLRKKTFSMEIFRPALIWSVCFAGLAGLLLLVLVGPRNIIDLLFSHFSATSAAQFDVQRFTLNMHLKDGMALLFLGYMGALFAVRRRQWTILYFLAWEVLAYAILSIYSPVFYHHQFLVTVPAAVLAAAGAGEAILTLLRIRKPSDFTRTQTFMALGAILAAHLVAAHALPILDQELMHRPQLSGFSLKATAGKLKVVNMMNQYVDQTNWIITDMPMYAFLVDRPVPPNLATFSRKRLVTGDLTEAEVLSAAREYKPEQVLMARFEIPALEAYLQENYSLVLAEEDFRLFVRNDIR